MPAKDKYFVFAKRAKGYRKGIHKVSAALLVLSDCAKETDELIVVCRPHFTKITSRTNPKGF